MNCTTTCLFGITRFFHNKHFHSDACPALIRCNVLTVGQLLEDDSSLGLIAPTWQAVYRDTIGQLATNMYEFDAQATHPAVCFSTLLAEWHAGTAMAALSYPKEIERRQDALVWEALVKSPLPDQDKDFVRVALWRKLQVGMRQCKWKPGNTLRPIDNKLETVDHACFDCKFLLRAFTIIDRCFHLYETSAGPCSSVRDLLMKTPDTAPGIPPGLLAWSAIKVNWDIRCALRKTHFHVSTSVFLTRWVKRPSVWQQVQVWVLSPKTPFAFIDVVLSSTSDSSVAYPTLSAIPPTPPPSRAQLRAARRLERKLRSLDKLNQHLDTLESEGFLLIYTDGSSEHFPTVGWVGGYGVYLGAGVEVSDFVPRHMKQTMNSEELLAALVALQSHADHPKIALCADSEYVLLGVKGAARRWKINGWRGLSGPVSNVPIWEEILQLLDDTFQEIKWVKVPSHVNVMGNDQANTLANQGRVNNPQYPVKGTPHGRRQHHTCTPHRTAKKPKLSVRETSRLLPSTLTVSQAPVVKTHHQGRLHPHLPPHASVIWASTICPMVLKVSRLHIPY